MKCLALGIGIAATLTFSGCSADDGENFAAYTCGDLAQSAQKESVGAVDQVDKIRNLKTALDHRANYSPGDGGIILRCTGTGRWKSWGEGGVVLELTERNGGAWVTWSPS